MSMCNYKHLIYHIYNLNGVEMLVDEQHGKHIAEANAFLIDKNDVTLVKLKIWGFAIFYH